MEISRRQFLNYCLTGVGGFLAAGMLAPMIKFAIDPALKKGDAATDMVPVANINEITEQPQNFIFNMNMKDVWIGEKKTPMSAWIYKTETIVVALSPICKHLGCTVSWNGSPQFPNEFYCPCHAGRYEKNGKNIPDTPPMLPLDQYEVQIQNGKVLLGLVEPNTIVNAKGMGITRKFLS